MYINIIIELVTNNVNDIVIILVTNKVTKYVTNIITYFNKISNIYYNKMSYNICYFISLILSFNSRVIMKIYS